MYDARQGAPRARTQKGETMKRIAAALLLASLLPASCLAAPGFWRRHWQEVAGDGLIVLATVNDGYSTCQGFSRGLVEASRLGRGSHSCGLTVGVLAGATVFYGIMNRLSNHELNDDPGKVWRFAGHWTIPAIAAGYHGEAAIHNYLLDRRFPPPPPTGPTR
jgi:hypothetical protein